MFEKRIYQSESMAPVIFEEKHQYFYFISFIIYFYKKLNVVHSCKIFLHLKRDFLKSKYRNQKISLSGNSRTPGSATHLKQGVNKYFVEKSLAIWNSKMYLLLKVSFTICIWHIECLMMCKFSVSNLQRAMCKAVYALVLLGGSMHR